MFSKAVRWIHAQDALLRQRYIYSWFGIHAVLRGASSFIAAEALQYFQVLHQCCKQHHGDCIQSFVFPFLLSSSWCGDSLQIMSSQWNSLGCWVFFSLSPSKCSNALFLAAASSPAVRAQTHAVVVLWALSRYKPFNRDPPISGSVVLDKLKVNELICIASRRHR